MATRPFITALGLIAISASTGTTSAQMAGYPNGGGRIPGTIAAGPQFPVSPSSAPPQIVPYSAVNGSGTGTTPTYVSPPVYSSSHGDSGPASPTSAPAVSYGTPMTAPITTPIATPIVPPPVPVVAAPPVATTAPTILSPNVSPNGSPNGPQSGPNSYGPGSYNGNYNTGNYVSGNYVPPTPDFSTPPAIPHYSPNNSLSSGPTTGPIYGQQPDMQVGRLTQKEISPYAKGSAPPSYTAWLPRSWAPQPATAYDNNPKNSNYGAVPPPPSHASVDPSVGGPSYPGEACNPGVPCPCAPTEPWYTNFSIISTLDTFKTPLDLDGLNANLGKRIGASFSFPIMRDWGFGGQVGSTAAWNDWRGTQFTGDQMRFQNFNTVALFQRSLSTGLGFGLAHDWLIDNYYDDFHFSQFRVAASWQVNPCNEVGLWGSLPQRRESSFIGTPVSYNRFQSLTQGNLYWKHYWSDFATSNIFAGLAESPSDITYGTNVQVAVTCYMAVTGAFEYVLPGSGGDMGRKEEIWNLSFGFLFYPGTAFTAQRSQFRPMFAPADNGNFATWRR
ncbi:MAG: hypothetical protein K8U03_15240 [Planctomycetia bacterium]|nr:hypothetical protein [Planctomycetia bacterium]